ncbi:MAG TPA: TetR/AcrR family transcriptional regulator [Pilimelia sp.]|nr:TetR/AcrR family transcriptional regulator [Pilimelia sp.]
MTTVIPPTRRERLRAATLSEIKDAARRMLVTGGATAISLRAIARDMGMTAPAIYRYFDNLDALVGALATDLFDEARQEVEAASEAVADGSARERMIAMARAFRAWSVAHPAEFGLLFGNPVPGGQSVQRACAGATDAGARFGAVFLATLAEEWEREGFVTPPAELIEGRLGPHLEPYREAHGPDLPLEVIYVFLAGWTLLYGLVAMEVFGHLQWALSDVTPLFELELERFLNLLAPPAAA